MASRDGLQGMVTKGWPPRDGLQGVASNGWPPRGGAQGVASMGWRSDPSGRVLCTYGGLKVGTSKQ